MIIVSIIICAVLGYYFAVFIENKKVGYSLSLTFIALFVLSLVLLISNEYGHLGMQKVTDEKTYQIQSVQKGSNLLLKKELGTNGKEDVYIYRTPETANKKKPQTTKVDSQVKNVVKTGDYSAATMTKKTTRWEYKNDFYSFLFGLSDNNKEFIKQKNTFKVGNDWLVLTTTQASQLQKKMKSKAFQAQMKQEGADYVKAAMMKAMQANPKMTPAEQKQATEQATKAFKAESQAKLIQEIKSQK
ncbi:DUF4811 domain-containing protein [Companilactobacillus kimchiensis]|uniref:DUF4811 domain-containing protein n=1 Tax=Companilactobacillus kimchiensis TaxID=993692 RepID=A0A0R2LD63_9LACO|nr:DUF4811 domain-containing protein [Companilactobacillus kimchiensis]KRN99849.1 hypothetical protein IV57_GL002181 [Companilactobacillus kimchiensis]